MRAEKILRPMAARRVVAAATLRSRLVKRAMLS